MSANFNSISMVFVQKWLSNTDFGTDGASQSELAQYALDNIDSEDGQLAQDLGLLSAILASGTTANGQSIFSALDINHDNNLQASELQELAGNGTLSNFDFTNQLHVDANDFEVNTNALESLAEDGSPTEDGPPGNNNDYAQMLKQMMAFFKQMMMMMFGPRPM